MPNPSFIDRLTDIVGPHGLLLEPQDKEPFLQDWRGLFRGDAVAVVRPRNVHEVAAVVAQCADAGIRVVPQGGNTGLAGSGVPLANDARQIVLSMSRMNAIRHIDRVGMTMEVEAGCILQTAQDAALAQGRKLAINLASEGSAQIGGVVASNAGGIHVVRYGMARQSVLGLEIVLADGTLVNGLRHLRKDNAGYDWKQLFIGSEGTLAIITAAVLRLSPQPRKRSVSLLAVPDAQAGLALLARAQDELGDQVSAFELISAVSMDLVARHSGVALPLAPGVWYVLLEVGSNFGDIDGAVEAMLEAALEAGEAVDGTIARSEAQAQQLWALRENITEAELHQGRSIKHDISVPVGAIPDFIKEASAAIAALSPGSTVNIFGHAGDGNLHFNVLATADLADADAKRAVHDVVARYNGSISAEHGIGQYRIDEMLRYKSGEELGLMARIKHALDPDNTLNPGKVM
ncbi:FAD-binding oxidoreductase [Mesorhizobium sp. CAU 1732]|uniref:FAD-binding oxidoreductase n=1 Tax=Mesorhizobium sp. CAU 1732 TaxID=3140358 RepID=UPI0032608DFB